MNRIFRRPSIDEQPTGNQKARRDHRREPVFGFHDPAIRSRESLHTPITRKTKNHQSDDHAHAQTEIRKPGNAAREAIRLDEDLRQGCEQQIQDAVDERHVYREEEHDGRDEHLERAEDGLLE